MAQKVEFVLDAKDAGAVQAWLAVQRAAEGYNATLGKIDDAQAEAAKSSAEWGAKAKKLLADLETPQQRHNRKLAEYSELRRRNLVDENQYAAAVRKSKAEMDSAGESGATSLASVGAKLTALVGGYSLVTGAVREFISANVELEKKAEEISDRYDVMFRRFQAMAGMKLIEGDAAKERIKQIAVDRALESVDQAESGATGLTSAGFSGQDASGFALNALLKTVSAQQLVGKRVDPGTIAASSAQYLASQDKELTGQNLLGLSVAIQSLKDTPIVIEDLKYLAKQGKSLSKAGLTEEEQLASFAVLRKSFDPSEAGVGLRNISLHMATASGAKDKVAALGEIGLKPEDIDMVGESFTAALGKLNAAINTAPEKDRNRLRKVLVESENIASFGALADSLPEIQARSGRLRDVEGFNADVALGERGQAAGGRRQALAMEVEIEKRNRNAAKLFNEIELMNLESGGSAFSNAAFRRAAESYQGLGYEPSQAATSALAGFRSTPFARYTGFTGPEQSVDIVSQAQNRLESRMAGMERLPELMEKQNRLVEEQLKAMKGGSDKPNVTPPAPVASSLNDSRIKTGRP